jgi:hypothetical protein
MAELEQLPPPGEQELNYRIIVFNCSVDNATSRCDVVDAGTSYGLENRRIWFDSQHRQEIVLSFKVSISAVGCMQPSIQ